MQREVVVRAFTYYCNGVHSGTLFLKSPMQQCAWWSVATGLRTDWHGTWTSWDNMGFLASFDWAGDRNTRKFTVVWHDYTGHDYRGRNIRVSFAGRWAFDDAVSDYVTY